MTFDDSEPRPNSREDIGGPLGYSRTPPPPRPPPVLQRQRATITHRDLEPENGGTMSKKTTENEEATREGPRGFAVLLQQIDDGDLHAEVGRELQGLIGELAAYSDKFQRDAKGQLTLVLNLSVRGNNVQVSGDVKTKTPKKPRAASVFWRTDGNNLSVDNPRQQKLPLREVPSTNTKPRDLPVDSGEARSV